MFESAKSRHAYDPQRQKRSVKWIWQAPGHYHVVLIQAGNPDWVGYWSSESLGKIPNKAALAEFLDYATHVVDNARKVGMIGDLPVTIYAFHEAQMGDHRRMLGIPDVSAGDGAWMEVKHRHPFVPVSYTRMSGFDEFGEMDFSDMSEDIQAMASVPMDAEATGLAEELMDGLDEEVAEALRQEEQQEQGQAVATDADSDAADEDVRGTDDDGGCDGDDARPA